jgi:hypothetical protein
MLVCSICQKKIIRGQMVSEEQVSHRPQISREAHIILSVMIWDVMMPLLWERLYSI